MKTFTESLNDFKIYNGEKSGMGVVGKIELDLETFKYFNVNDKIIFEEITKNFNKEISWNIIKFSRLNFDIIMSNPPLPSEHRLSLITDRLEGLDSFIFNFYKDQDAKMETAT